MNETQFQRQIIELVVAGDYKISDHALDALLDDDLERADIVSDRLIGATP